MTEKDILAMQSGSGSGGSPRDTGGPAPSPLTSSSSAPLTAACNPLSPLGNSSTTSSSSLPQRPVGAFGVGTLGSGSSFGLGPGSFSMGGITAPQNVPSILTPLSPAIPSPVVVPVAAPVSQALLETIKKVAQFCASNGASTISMLKKKDGAINVMPFLFEGQAGYETFLSTLKTCLGMAVPSAATATGASSSSSTSKNVSKPK